MKLFKCFIIFFLFSCKLNNSKLRLIDIDLGLSKIKQTLIDSNQIDKDSLNYYKNSSLVLSYNHGIGISNSILALYYEKNKKLDSSLKYYKEALIYYNLNFDTFRIANTFLNIANIYSDLKEQTNRFKNLKSALGLLKFCENSSEICRLYNDLGVYYAETQKLDSSKFFFRKCLINSINKNDTSLISNSYVNIANIFNELDDDSAIFYYQKSLNLNLIQKNYQEIGKAYNNIAEFYWYRNIKDSVKKYILKSKELIVKYQSINEKINLFDDLSYFYEEDFKLKQSIETLRLKDSLKDELFNQNITESIANIEKDYTVKLKSEENAKLASELKRKNTLRNASIVTALLLAILGLYQYRSYRQKRKILEAEKELKDQEINQILKEKEVENLEAIIEGREAEQKRIGRDLHDRLGSILSTVKLHFSAIDEKIDSLKLENKIQYDKASSLLDEAVNEVRKIAHDLSSGVLVKQGLKAAIVDLKNTIESSGKIKVNFFETGELMSPNLEFEINLYRIIQELLSNVLKHANASKIDIHLTQHDHQITLIIEDNGNGFDALNSTSFGIGIANIKQRVAGLGGEISFDSHVGKGCSVIVEINQ